MKNYLDKLNAFNDKDVENALDNYIEDHIKQKNLQQNIYLMR